ncbi:MAG: aldo/keto reductase [Eubacteriales bacterium]
MQYRKFGKTGEEVSVLGFGCMRFQTNNDDTKDIKEDLAIKQIRYSIDKGVNYIDTAYPYHGKMSEPLVGKALQKGYREKVKLATKLPSWLIKKREDFDKYMKEQMEKLQTDYIDFYLVHAINKERWDNLNKHNLFEFLDQVKKDGRAKYVGFSFHDELPLFKEVVDSYDWDFCQIQYNYLDKEYQAGEEGLNYGADKGLGIIVMEPLRGGKLTKKVPEDISSIFEKSERNWTPAQWGFKFVWNNPKVHVVLSGMNQMDHIDENIQTAEETTPNSLNPQDLEVLSKVEKIYNERIVANCTDCKYCMPCPNGVDIPANIEMINEAYMFDDIEGHKESYAKFIEDDKKASNCIECGLCEPKCPQHISIMAVMKKVDRELG